MREVASESCTDALVKLVDLGLVGREDRERRRGVAVIRSQQTENIDDGVNFARIVPTWPRVLESLGASG